MNKIIIYLVFLVPLNLIAQKDTILKKEFEEAVIISATKWKQPQRRVPQKVSVIKTKDVVLHNPQTAADLLAISNEVFIQKSQQGGGSPMIRGFSSNRLLYSVDGIRMNNAIFRSGNIQNVISLDPLAIENTEVIFGPGAILYGSDAIGGVMSFQTLTPTFSENDQPLIKANALLRTATANQEFTKHFNIQVGWKNWAILTSVSHYNFGDLRMGANGIESYLKPFTVSRIDSVDRLVENKNPTVQDPSGYQQINLMQKIRFAPSQHIDLQYGFHFSETSEFSRYDRLIETNTNRLPIFAVWNYGPQKWMMHHFMMTDNKKNSLYDQMTLRLAFQDFEESRIDRRWNQNRLRTNTEKVKAYSLNMDMEKRIGKHFFFYGIEGVLNDVNSNGSAMDIRNGNAIAVADRYPQASWLSYAAYLNYQYHLSDKWLFQGGIRANGYYLNADFSQNTNFFPFSFNSTSIHKLAPSSSLGMVFNPDLTTKLSANISTGFRAPNVDDIGKMFDFVAGDVVVPNTRLGAEYAYNAEIHASKVINKSLKIDFTGFYTLLDQAMVRRPILVQGADSIEFNGIMSKTYAIQNAAQAQVFGFNAGFEIKLPYGFGLESRFNYQIGNEEMDNGTISRSRHAAPPFGTTKIYHEYKKWKQALYTTYCFEVSHENLNEEERQKPFIYAKDANGKPFTPAWMTLNYKFSYSITSNMTLSGGIENIMDLRYRPYSSGLVAPGRNMILAIKVDLSQNTN